MRSSLKIEVVLFGVVFWILVFSTVQAATYYIAPTGNNSSPGTVTQPFATLQKAHDVANPGDTIYMRGGTYLFTSPQILTRDGNNGNPIRLYAYPGERPVIDAINATIINTGNYYDGWAIALNSASWWHIKGLEIRNAPAGGLLIYAASHSNIIESNDIHHNGRISQYAGSGIQLLGSGANNLILNNDLHHNRDVNKGNADGFAGGGTTGTGNVVRGNRAWRNSDDGFDFFNSQDNTSGGAYIIENNWAWENGYDDKLQPLGEGNAFKLGGTRSGTSGKSGGHTVKNNMAWRNRGHGFLENGANISLFLFNNTAWNHPGDNYLFQKTVSTFHNNIDYVNGQGRHINASSNVTHNSWTLPVTVTNDDFVSLDYSNAFGPRDADGSLPTINFLRLAVGSDLIDKGTNVGIAYFGSAPDLGAYEYAGSVASLQPPSNLVVQP